MQLFAIAIFIIWAAVPPRPHAPVIHLPCKTPFRSSGYASRISGI